MLVITARDFKHAPARHAAAPAEDPRGDRLAPARRIRLARPASGYRRTGESREIGGAEMAATATEHKLLIDGEWVETGDWIEVRSPYSGEVVGRVAKGGAAEARRAVDAAARALESPLPAHKRAEILVKVAGADRPAPRGARADDLRRGRQADQDGARRGLARDVDLHVRRGRGTQARRRDDRRWTARRPARASSASRCASRSASIGAISPFNFPCNLVAHKIAPALAAGCPVVLKPASADAAVGALARGARARGGPAAGLAQRRRRPCVGDRRRPRRGRARQADHVHRLERASAGTCRSARRASASSSSSATRRR